MAEPIKLHGYSYSVYNRVARLALEIKRLSYERVEINPFLDLDPAYLELHPFGRVPVLSHGSFNIFETIAICRYIDNAFDGTALIPSKATTMARMDQVIAIVDNYGYWPMVRQVFSHRVFRPLIGEKTSKEEVSAGLIASEKVLAALNRISEEGHILTGKTVTLADCHLAPMIDYFVRAPEGQELLESYPGLWHWWDEVSEMSFMVRTDPKLPDLKL
ncbi:MAG: glutathione S-transferase family protein [Henriciella sp.]|nr:glutathione S-transferase family protein [Henriciella sp.]